MSKKRKLTVAEMREFHDKQLVIEQAENPGYEVKVLVLPETDDEGNPQYTVERQRETEL